MNLNDLDTFVVVAEAGTFSAAAARLGVPKSTVSRRVARLEESLGLALLTRSSRSFVLSDDGRALFERCGPALREIDDVARDLADSPTTPRGRLHLTTSIDFGSTAYVAQLLTDYRRRHPQVTVQLTVTNRVVDLLEEGIDLAFRTHGATLQSRDDLVARRLGRVEVGAYASPAYLQSRGTPACVAELSEHTVVAHRVDRDVFENAHPQLVVDDYRPLAALLVADAGVGLLPDFVASPMVARGLLQPVLAERPKLGATLSLVWLRSRHLSPRLRAFIDLAVDHTGRVDWLS